MILAIILLSGLSSTGLVHACLDHAWLVHASLVHAKTVAGPSQSAQSTQKTTDANPPVNPPGAQVSSGSQQSAPSTPAPKTGEPAPTTKKVSKVTHTKKAASTDCSASPVPVRGGGASTDKPGPSGSSTGTGTNPPQQAASTNCPPKKTIVRQGGTSEPSIQLEVGIVGERADQQKDSTNQMLGATEQNLKKLEGRELSPNQQNMVGQARQFVDEARRAITAGDLDRARTLAWKAQVLSEDLVRPEN